MTVNGALRLLVLKVLNEEDANGSLILSKIENKTGWRASPGSFYPLMQDLAELKFVTFEKDANIKTYSITEKGRYFLEKTDKQKREIISKINEGVSLLSVFGVDLKEECSLANIDKHVVSIVPLHDSVTNLKDALLSVNIIKNHSQINKLLNEVADKIKKLQ